MSRTGSSVSAALTWTCVALCVRSSGAQDLIISSLAMPLYAETTAPGPFYPGPNSPRFTIPEAMAIAPAMVPFMGDLTMDNATGIIYHSNGVMITATNHPAYPAIVAAPPPFAAPTGMGPLTAIAIDGATGVLWCTDGVVGLGVLPLPGTPAIGLPFAILGPVPVVAPPLVGLDWDPITASLWAVDFMGNVYNFLPGAGAAVPIGPQPVIPFLPMMPPPAVDIVLHRHPGILAGIHVQGVGASLNVLTGVLTMTPAGFIPPGTEDGIAFHDYPNTLPVPTCMFCPGMGTVTVGTTGPMSLGNAAFALTLSGLPAFAPVFIGVSAFAALPPLPPVTIPSGCQLYLSPTLPLLLVAPVVASPTGVATVPAPLAGLPPASLGLLAFIQWAYGCPVSGALLLSEAQQFILEAP